MLHAFGQHFPHQLHQIDTERLGAPSRAIAARGISAPPRGSTARGAVCLHGQKPAHRCPHPKRRPRNGKSTFI